MRLRGTPARGKRPRYDPAALQGCGTRPACPTGCAGAGHGIRGQDGSSPAGRGEGPGRGDTEPGRERWQGPRRGTMSGTAGTAIICLLRCDLRAHDNQVGTAAGVCRDSPAVGKDGEGSSLHPAPARSVIPGAPLGSAQRRFRDSCVLLRPAALPGHPLLQLAENGAPQAQVFAGKCEGSEGNAQEKRKVVEKAPCK